MAPKAMAPKAKAKTGKEVVPPRNGKMAPSKKKAADQVTVDPKVLEQQEKAQKLLALRAARKLQRYCRLMRVQSAVRAITLLEEDVLVVPMPGEQALEFFLAGPKEEGAAEDDSTGSVTASMADPTSTRPSSRPGSAEGRVQAGQVDPVGVEEEDRPGSRGSQDGSSSAWSGAETPRSLDSDEENPPHISEHSLAHQLKKWDVEEPARMASLLFFLLAHGNEFLYAADFERVYRHHRIRRRNVNSKVLLYLALVQHGDAGQVYASRPPTAGPLPCDGPRPMVPEGWDQVTRIAWAIRLCPNWSPPGVIFTASSQCCTETAERLHLVLENPADKELTKMEHELHPHHQHDQEHHTDHHRRPHHHDHHHGRHHGSKKHHHHNDHHDHSHHRACPPPTTCDALDFPRSHALLGPATYLISEALGAFMRASENPNCNPKLKPKEPTPSLLVAGGTLLETLLGTLTASRPFEEMITARLRGGDAVLLRSAPMCGILGEDLEERFRPNSNLWEEAMRRDDWNIVHHLRGDGTGQPIELGGIPKVELQEPSEFKTRLTAQWNRYAGTALILTDSEYLDIRKRAGFAYETGMGMDPRLVAKIKPLVKDYQIPAEEEMTLEEFRNLSHHGHDRHAAKKHNALVEKPGRHGLAGMALAATGDGNLLAAPGTMKRTTSRQSHASHQK